MKDLGLSYLNNAKLTTEKPVTSILKDLGLSYLNNAKLTTEKPVHFYTERPKPNFN